MVPLYFESATSLALKIRRGEITSEELTLLFIQRIEQFDASINAVVVRCFEEAIMRAKELDGVFAKDGSTIGPLHGVPITVKENNDVKGLATMVGDPTKKDAPVAYSNSPLVQRLLDAGAVILGKTNLPIGCNDVQTYNTVYGTTSNPYDLSRTPGGSSGGSAAALCAGLTALELGGDIGGSIRVPAACCGIFGHKSTLSAIPFSYGPTRSHDIVVKGPLSRSSEDLELAMKLLAHIEGPAKRALTIKLPCNEKKKHLKDFRVAIWYDDAVCPVDSDILTALKKLVINLNVLGCTHVVEGAKPFDEKYGWKGGSAKAFRIYKCLLATEENLTMTPEEAQALLDTITTNTTYEKRKQIEWITQSAQSWHRANIERQNMRMAYERFFEEFDVLVCPICVSVAWPKDESGSGSHEWEEQKRSQKQRDECDVVQHFWQVGNRSIPGADGHKTPYHDQVFWSGVTNICGNPSTVFPAGRAAKSKTNMPVGLQVVGSEWNDLTTIAFVKALEKEGGYSFVPPKGY